MRRRIAAIPSNGSVFEQGLENIKMLVEGNSPDPRCMPITRRSFCAMTPA